jgi:hypothetical protein
MNIFDSDAAKKIREDVRKDWEEYIVWIKAYRAKLDKQGESYARGYREQQEAKDVSTQSE